MDELGGKDKPGLREEIFELERKRSRLRKNLHEVVEPEIKGICNKFRLYKIKMDFEKILDSDYSDITEAENELGSSILTGSRAR